MKYHFIFDNIKKNKKIKKIFLNKYKNYKPKESTCIIVLGGDGFMLDALKKYRKFKKPFYGINRGTFGFLMNRFKSYDINKIISSAKVIKISPLEMKAINKSNKIFNAIAVNEVSLLRQSRQTASLGINVGKKNLLKKLVCDGVLISTPAGSTAYNLSVNGPILSLNSKKMAITPISPFRPRRWKGKIVTSSAVVKVYNNNITKRSVSVVADNVEIRNIKSVIIRSSNTITFKLLYDKSNLLTKKIKQEQNIKKKYSFL
ncbi:MAG: NAD+ kinase [Pelagibacterales bacterium]|nr:NAD+ kinase [Pelagibacterales bacterium]